MKRKLVAAIAALGAAAAGQANLVVNGDFEVPLTLDASGSPGYLVVMTGDSTSIGAWTSGGRSGDTSVDIVNSLALPTYPSNTGVQHIDLAGSPGPGSIHQMLSTVPSGAYTLSFAGSSNGSSKTMEVYWDGSLLDTILCPAQGTWQTFTYNVVASGALTELRFGSLTSNSSNTGPLLDTVSVSPVPEPATGFVLLTAGLASLAKRRRK